MSEKIDLSVQIFGKSDVMFLYPQHHVYVLNWQNALMLIHKIWDMNFRASTEKHPISDRFLFEKTSSGDKID